MVRVSVVTVGDLFPLCRVSRSASAKSGRRDSHLTQVGVGACVSGRASGGRRRCAAAGRMSLQLGKRLYIRFPLLTCRMVGCQRQDVGCGVSVPTAHTFGKPCRRMPLRQLPAFANTPVLRRFQVYSVHLTRLSNIATCDNTEDDAKRYKKA